MVNQKANKRTFQTKNADIIEFCLLSTNTTVDINLRLHIFYPII